MHKSVRLLDYDQDGWLDVFVTNVNNENDFLYRNNGDGTFSAVVGESPVTHAGRSQAAAWADYNNDGCLDLFVTCGDAEPQANYLHRNNGNTNGWLSIRLIGTVSNRSAVGAKVRLQARIAAQSLWQFREISGASALGGGVGLVAHFGLGDAEVIDVIRSEWPSGIVQEFKDIIPNQILTVTEPPRLIAQSPGGFRIQCWVNQSFDVQASTDLADWVVVDTVTNETGTLVFSDADGDQHTCRYYRVVAK